MELDFGYEQIENDDNINSADESNESLKTDLSTGQIDNTVNNHAIENIDEENTNNTESLNNNDDSNTDNSTKGTIENNDIKNKDTEKNNNVSKEKLKPGTIIEVGDEKYTVDNNGNIVDKDNNIFKFANDVDLWLQEFDNIENSEDKDTISIDSIQEAFGIEITDDNDNPIKFENNSEGIKSYINAVVESIKDEQQEIAINNLYKKYPILNDVLNYYIANDNSLEGFGEIPDRSNIVIDETNETQQEAIIRAAWVEQGRKGNIDNYINYLKSSGILLATAKEELEALQESDAQYRKELEEEAERKENERIKELTTYWNDVHKIIQSKQIAGYQIPDKIVINKNGQKLSVTPEDFYNYLYRVDKNGQSAYMKDLAQQSPESRREDEILRAYLMFVGGNYSNLVNMAINKEKVTTLKFRAKERNNNTVRITNPTKVKNNLDIDLGYN